MDARVREFLDRMCMLMRLHKGVGLAANQVGLDERLIVVEVTDRVYKLVNPRITRKEGEIAFLEGCLSFPGLEIKIKRANKIWISALDESGQDIDIEASGVLAVVFQHEIDHIDGIVFISRLDLLERLKALTRPRLKHKKT